MSETKPPEQSPAYKFVVVVGAVMTGPIGAIADYVSKGGSHSTANDFGPLYPYQGCNPHLEKIDDELDALFDQKGSSFLCKAEATALALGSNGAGRTPFGNVRGRLLKFPAQRRAVNGQPPSKAIETPDAGRKMPPKPTQELGAAPGQIEFEREIVGLISGSTNNARLLDLLQSGRWKSCRLYWFDAKGTPAAAKLVPKVGPNGKAIMGTEVIEGAQVAVITEPNAAGSIFVTIYKRMSSSASWDPTHIGIPLRIRPNEPIEGAMGQLIRELALTAGLP
jgi:hypothetical protein